MKQQRKSSDPGFAEQFSLPRETYMRKLDFLNWYRYFHIVKEILDSAPKAILEIGAGDGFIRRLLAPEVSEYKVLDINEKLAPDYHQDLREYNAELANRFDCVMAADVLEHIPFADFPRCLAHIREYLKESGNFLATIPHRRSYFLFMSPTYKPHVLSLPTGFLSPGAFYRRFIKRRIWIDPNHCWEIGDGHIKQRDVEAAFVKAGFEIKRRKRLLYVDYWVLAKAGAQAAAPGPV